MRWIVSGADKATGEQRTMTVTADSKTDAERIANTQGLMVDRAEAVSSLYGNATADPTPPQAPEYTGLIFGGRACDVLGVVLLLVGAVGIGAAIFADSRKLEFLVAGASGLTIGLAWLVVSAALDALRDIARNSFR